MVEKGVAWEKIKGGQREKCQTDQSALFNQLCQRAVIKFVYCCWMSH